MYVDQESGEPEWLQIARQLREQITAGHLPVGAPLPSSRQAQAEHGIGRQPWMRAVAELRAQGLVTMRRGLGAWVAARPPVRQVELRAGDRVAARAATEEERRALNAGLLAPVLVVTRADGQAEVHSGAVTVCLVV